MRCTQCDYPLWNLKARECPECGSAFVPSEREFVCNSVRFCCPHCDQEYYGTGLNGHLEPTSFECVQCGTPVTMDEMVLRPTAGVDEAQTKVDTCPWLERRRQGRFRSWVRTLGRSMVSPLRLIRAVPLNSSLGQAWWYALLTLGLLLIGGSGVPFFVIGLIELLGGGGSPGPLFFATGVVVGGVAVAAVGIGLWGLVTHGLLLVTGGAPHPLGRTYQALCYSAGAAVTLAVPCIGLYPLGVIGFAWWVVSAVLMVTAGQQVHGGRAALATLAFPGVLALLVVVGFFGLMFWGMSQAQVAAAQASSMQEQGECQTLLDAVVDEAEAQGAWPAHPLALLPSGAIQPFNLVSMWSATGEQNVAVGDTDLGRFGEMGTNEQQRRIDALLAGEPGEVTARRVGDYLFTYSGIDLDTGDPALWIVIASPHPDHNLSKSMVNGLAVGTLDRTVEVIPEAAFADRLAEQNELRAAQGLPVLPLPWEVR